MTGWYLFWITYVLGAAISLSDCTQWLRSKHPEKYAENDGLSPALAFMVLVAWWIVAGSTLLGIVFGRKPG